MLGARRGGPAARFASRFGWHPAVVFVAALLLAFVGLVGLSVLLGLLFTDGLLRVDGVSRADQRAIYSLAAARRPSSPTSRGSPQTSEAPVCSPRETAVAARLRGHPILCR